MNLVFQVRMYLLIGVMFGILYTLVALGSSNLGVTDFYFYGALALIFLLAQYFASPYVVEKYMELRYVSESEEPELHGIVKELARAAGVPKPRVGIAEIGVPNAFAFGKWAGDARVGVTRELLKALNREELRAVLGHEIAHIKNRDVPVITMLSMVPMLCWYVFVAILSRRSGGAVLAGIAFLLYILANLLVLYGSRLREHYADIGSIKLGSQPAHLASAIYKLVAGSAAAESQELKKIEGLKAFFLNDPSKAKKEIRELKEIDLNLDGVVSREELNALAAEEVSLAASDRIMELLSSHPNAAKRIKLLAEME